MSADAPNLTDDVRRAAQAIQHAATVVTAFAGGPALLALLEERLARCAREAESPYVNRAAAAARWFKSTSEIDRAAKAGIITRIATIGGPLFLKSEGDEAIRTGRWTQTTVAEALAKQRKAA